MAISGFNPIATTNAAGSFAVSAAGFMQGVFQDDPALRYELGGGILGPNETIPMWGGVLISESTTPVASSGTSPRKDLGGYITRATSLPGTNWLWGSGTTANVATGFSVFNGAHAMLNWPQNPVPIAQNYGQVNFIRFGSGLRLPVACAAVLADLEGGGIGQAVSWDYTLQQLVPYTPGFAQTTITGATWASTSGGQTTFTVGTDLTADLSAGDLIEVSGVVSTGGTGVGFNGQFSVVSVSSTQVVVTQAAASSPGTYSSGGHILAQGGALPVRVLDVQIGNSMTVLYNATLGTASWVRNGNCALILV